METLQNIFQAEIIQRLGWALVHFVWQATAVALVLAIVLKLLHKSSANVRYIIACMALALIVLMPVVTIRMVDVSVEAIEPIKEAAVVDLPKAGVEAQAIIEMPQAESLPAQVAVMPRAPLKDRFIKAVELFLPYVVLGWLVGVFGLSLWHLGGWRQLQRLRKQMVKQVAPTLKAKLQQLSNALSIQKTIGLVESALVQVPTVVGHLKPVILLPASALTGLSSEQIEAILAHELAHIKRCDYLVNMLQTVVEILGFYHPAVWWVSAKIRNERENCCDDIAVSVSGDKVRYAKALTLMEEIRAEKPQLAVAASGGSLFGRISRLVGRESADKTKAGWIPSVIAILLIMAVVIPASLALTGHAKPKLELAVEENTREEQSGYKKTLTNGVTVELVGVTNHYILSERPERQTWWRPDGNVFGKIPYAELGWSSTVSAPDNAIYEFAVKVKDENKYSYAAKSPRRYDSQWVDQERPKSIIGEPLPRTRAFIGEFRKDTSTGDVSLGIATGEWEKVEEWGNPKWDWTKDNIDSMNFQSDKPAVFTWPREEKGAVVVSVTHRFTNEARRLALVDKKGDVHTAGYSVAGSGSGLERDVYYFWKVRREDIAKFVFEKRPYEWVEFKNVSLKPKFKSAVTVEEQLSRDPITIDLEKQIAEQKLILIKERSNPDRDQHNVRQIQELISVLRKEKETRKAQITEQLRQADLKNQQAAEWRTDVDVEETSVIKQVMMLADREARYFGHEYIGTEHMLLAIATENVGIASRVLKDFDVGRNELRFELRKVIKQGTEPVTKKKLPKTPRAEKAIERAIQEAKALNSDTVNSGHILLGLLQIKDGVAAQILINLGLNLEYLRQQVLTELGQKAKTDVQVEGENGQEVILLGMRLVDVTPEIQAEYQLYHPYGVLVLEPGFVYQRLDIGELAEGCYFWQIGHKTIHNVQEMIVEILRINANPRQAGGGSVGQGYKGFIRVVYGYGKGRGTNTTYMKLTTEDAAELRRAGKALGISVDKLYQPGEMELEARIESAKKLSDLGKRMLLYANDYEKYPDCLQDLEKTDMTEQEINWLRQNIEYLGDKIKLTASPDTVLAYNKTLLMQEDSQGTNVLYNDSHVSFEKTETLKKLGIATEEKLVPQILTSGYILSVPADLPQLKEIIPADKSKPRMITPEKLEEFLKVINTTPGTRRISTPKLLTNDGETGEIRTENAEGFESIKLNIKNTVQLDRKTVKLELDFEYILNDSEDQKMTSVSTKATVLSDHAIAVAGGVSKNQAILLLVKPEILERQFSKTGVVAADAMEGEVFRIPDINFEPIRQGKNVVWITVKNKSDKEQFFGVNVYSRSVDYGPQGVGWGTTFYEKFEVGQTKKLRYVYKIQGPVTKNTYTKLRFYNAKSLEHRDNKDLQPFAKKQYSITDLKLYPSDKAQVPTASQEQFEAVSQAFIEIQQYIHRGNYEKAWNLFTEDYKKAEYQSRGFEAFKRQMEPKHSLDSAFTWERIDFLSLKPQKAVRIKSDDIYTLVAASDSQQWQIDFIKDNNQWKIDWVSGYTPRVIQNWEDRVLPKRQKYSSEHFDIYYEKGSPAEKDVEKIAENRDEAFEKICEFLGTGFDKRIKLVLFEDANTKLFETGHQGDGWSYNLTIVEVYNKSTQLDPFTSTSYIVKGYLGDPPALFNYGFSLYMVEQLGQKALKNLSGGDLSLYQRAKQLKEQDQWIPLAELITFTDIGPAESQPKISYAEAGAFAKFLIDTFGRDKFLQAYKQLKNSEDKTIQQQNIELFEQIYGKKLHQIEKEWQTTFLDLRDITSENTSSRTRSTVENPKEQTEMKNRLASMKSKATEISITVFPIIMSEKPYKNVAEVIALMLERADVNNIDIPDEEFSPAMGSDIWQICDSFGAFVRKKSIDTDYALFGEYVGTPQSGVKEVRCVVVDKAGNRVWVDRQTPEDDDFKRIKPNNPMLCSHLLVERLRMELGLPEQSGRNSAMGKWAKHWRKDSGAPPASERVEMAKRLAIMRENFRDAKLTIFPTLVNGKPNKKSADSIREMLNDRQLCLSGRVSEEVLLEITRTSNQQKRLWDLARKFKAYIQDHKLEADYTLYADYLISATKNVGGVHFVICDSNGEWIIVDFQNEYQSDFKSISPKTVSDCDSLVIKRIRNYLDGKVP